MLSSERVRREIALRGAVLAGDKAAWRTLYDGAHAELWACVVWRCAGLRDLAEDIPQETWLVAVRRMRDFDPERGRFVSWLRGIAALTIRNHFRARRLRLTQSLGARDLAAPAKDADPAELIARALVELPERYEAALRAKYLDALSVAQIAEEWSETPKAIESLLTRARHEFRTAYEKLAGTDVNIREMKP
jgi:RNA polymerase sigma-70 factor (ECF subfamily)